MLVGEDEAESDPFWGILDIMVSLRVYMSLLWALCFGQFLDTQVEL
jgi:hypothetical protein